MFELVSKYSPSGDQPEAIKELVQITPQSAIIKTRSGEKEVTIDEVKIERKNIAQLKTVYEWGN